MSSHVTELTCDTDMEQPSVPWRHMRASASTVRWARPLAWIARVRTPDQALLARIGERMMQRDELAAAVANAMSNDTPANERISMQQVHRALASGIDSVPDAPLPLRFFFETVTAIPEWVDFDEVERGARAIRRAAHVFDDVLLQLSLIGGFRFGGPPDLLVLTGAWNGPAAGRRVNETRAWTYEFTQSGALQPGGAGYRATLHVRLMHAMVNRRYENDPNWDTNHWGLPINQADLAGTLGLFNSTSLLGLRALGWFISSADARAVMHLWRYVGWLMGVPQDWLFTTEREQNIFNYHIVLAQDFITDAGPALANAIIAVEGAASSPGRIAATRARYRQARMVSMMRLFLRKKGMQDLQLPVRLPWAILPATARNMLESLVIARISTGRDWLERAGDRHYERRLGTSGATGRVHVGQLPPS